MCLTWKNELSSIDAQLIAHELAITGDVFGVIVHVVA